MIALRSCLERLRDQQGVACLHADPGRIPCIRTAQQTTALSETVLEADTVMAWSKTLMEPHRHAVLAREQAVDAVHREEGLGAFKVHAFMQTGALSLLVRVLPDEAPSIEALGLPPIVKSLIMSSSGLLLLSGRAGSGRAATVAALLDYRNAHKVDHILTIEDPLHCVHTNKMSVVHQREVGVDVHSVQDAMHQAMRQCPDVLWVGEIQDHNMLNRVMRCAESLLCVAMCSASGAAQAVERLVSMVPTHDKPRFLVDLGQCLRGAVSHKKLPAVDHTHTVATEVLLGIPAVSESIQRSDWDNFKTLMEQHEKAGMQSFDASLCRLHEAGKISSEQALKHASSQSMVRSRMRDAAERNHPEGTYVPSHLTGQNAAPPSEWKLE